MNIKTVVAAGVAVIALASCSGAARDPGSTTAPSESAGADASPAASAAADATPVIVRDFSLDPADLTVQGPVALEVSNEGPTVHNVSIRDGSGTFVDATADLKTGEADTLTVTIPAGTYTLYCSLPGHESLGIKGTLTITE